MRVEVLVLRAAHAPLARTVLYTYRVPATLAATIQPGHLVAVPFGKETAAGIVWTLDASDEIAGEPPGATPQQSQLRLLHALLLPEPILLAAQRALAEWLADYYATSLNAAARLFVPPGVLRSVRQVLRPTADNAPVATRTTAITATTDEHALISEDEAALAALLRDRGWLDGTMVAEALGADRAQTAVRGLLARGAITQSAEVGEVFTEVRRERLVRLAATEAERAAWQVAARARLDALAGVAVAASTNRRGPQTARKSGTNEERQAERILRQLAVLDVLGRTREEVAHPQARWRIQELRRLTRATGAALAELEAANLIAIEQVEARHDPLAGRHFAQSQPPALTPAQSAALAQILAGGAPVDATDTAGENGQHGAVFLLHGITGSGKTEVYLHALAATLATGKRGIVLVPEIALTPQAVARFAGRFPGRVALLHSGLTDAERLDEWRRIHAGAVDVVVGSRSALFAPIERLGLVIVDEEHEAAYKESRAPTYHARDVAVQLGALTGATVVLGSATPSVEAYWQARRGAFHLVELRERAPVGTGAGAPPSLPPVTLIDLRAELRAGNTSVLSQQLRTALHETLERGEQAILFLNRRGTASSVVCRECGYVVCCERCDVSMTFHAGERAVICHYCGRRSAAPTTCPLCASASIRYFGLGTERIESGVKRLFPQARVLRWDRDTTRSRQAHEELLRAFAERRADVLVGTQMIAKGLDLPGVTLVGVVSADIALFLPDVRASERAFQLLTQVAGRAGRGAQQGRVLVQTFNPEHFCIQAAAHHDYDEFIGAELIARERYEYPPFRRFVKCTFEHRDRYTAQIEATVLAERCERLIADLGLTTTDLVGPAPAFMERLRGRYRWQIIVRTPDPRPLLHALADERLPYGWSIDVDPASTL